MRPHIFWTTAFLDFDSDHFEKGVVFWAEATAYDVSSPRGGEGEFATLVPRTGDGFLRVQRRLEGPSRIHLDLHVSDPREAADRAVGLGGTEVSEQGANVHHDYVVMASPAGLTFCFVTQAASTRPTPAAWPGGRSLVDQVCLDISEADYDVECEFWRDLTGWELRESQFTGGFRSLVRPEGQPLRFLFQPVGDDRRPATAHLDLASDDRAAEVARHESLGARLRDTHDNFTVLVDPAGSAYCITDRDPDTGLLAPTSSSVGSGSTYSADERTMLLAFLNSQRESVRRKTEGLDAEQLNTALAPADLTLGGLLKHLAHVEDWWLGVNLAGVESPPPFDDVDWDADEDWDWHSAAAQSPTELRALFDEFVARSDALMAEAESLDVIAKRLHPRTGEGLSLRWILLHLVEEYARHLGHADLIRQSIDGQTGD